MMSKGEIKEIMAYNTSDNTAYPPRLGASDSTAGVYFDGTTPNETFEYTITFPCTGEWKWIDWEGDGELKPLKTFDIEKVVFVDYSKKDSTILCRVYWTDGTETQALCMAGDQFVKELGIALCIAKRMGFSYSRIVDEADKAYWSEPKPKFPILEEGEKSEKKAKDK